jgi:2-dehydro-3-deoxygalactonokinase
MSEIIFSNIDLNFEKYCEHMQSKKFISVDWGTSNFRMRLINTTTLEIIKEVKSTKGVKEIYNDWLYEKGNREEFFLNFLKTQCIQFKSSFDDTFKILISGMASSSLGIRELPYSELPISSKGDSIYLEKINTTILKNPIHLISGIKTKDDVIRGEEVQILGLISDEDIKGTTVFILPGTHSKHIIFKNNAIVDFKTFMTGEVFDVITKNTILRNSVCSGTFDSKAQNAFKKGVIKSSKNQSILNTIFNIRTSDLFQERTTTANFHYLSGLLIGEELKTLKAINCNLIKLCAGSNIFELYNIAIKTLGLGLKTILISKETVDNSVIKGHLKLLKKIEKL